MIIDSQTPFQLVAPFKPAGDQGKAIKEVSEAFLNGKKRVVLKGVTGSGKTFTMAHIIERLKWPTLVLSHNKTLAAQLYRELKNFFPHNAVEYFVSYYDYYQPEAYLPTDDLYIEKDASINMEIDMLRLRATASLLERDDCIVVATVSAIYGLGNPSEYSHKVIRFSVGDELERNELIKQLISLQYKRNDLAPSRGQFTVMGETITVFPAYQEDRAIRIDFFGDEVEEISILNSLTLTPIRKASRVAIYPAKHFLTQWETLANAIQAIEQELEERIRYFKERNRFLEAQRIEQRTRHDLEMLATIGYCNGIENYSRHLSGRKPGERPACLFDYFPRPFLLIIDESHVTVPQIRGMYEGDRSRKQTLVDYGFRLPSALDNRPLKFHEFNQLAEHILYVSATPSDYEIKDAETISELIVRPTGLVDPPIEVRPKKGQIEDLLQEIRKTVDRGERVLITTLTKRMAEDLTAFLLNAGVKVRYLHADIETIKRVEIIRDLRMGRIDCIVGINLLREGLDMPEVSLVAILDADKAGFLRNATSLIQTAGRAARNVHGRVIFYADTITDAMQQAIEETNRRRQIQIAYNQKHGITPKTITKKVEDIIERQKESLPIFAQFEKIQKEITPNKKETIARLRQQMFDAAKREDFETAAMIRDLIKDLEKS